MEMLSIYREGFPKDLKCFSRTMGIFFSKELKYFSLEWECFSPLTQTLPSLHTFLDPFDDIGSFEENYSTLICPNLSPSPLDCDRERILPDPGYESGGKRNNARLRK